MIKERKPDFERLVTTLRGGKADAIPLLELGVHPKVKAALLGREIGSIRDEAEFNRLMGYDYVKIQPGIVLEVNRKKTSAAGTQPDVNMPDRAWAVEGQGVITSWEEFHAYPFPNSDDITYGRFEEIKGALPDGMGIIGQYGDIFTTVWEMMGFEQFAVAMYEDPPLIEALFDKVGTLIVSMYERMAEMPHVGAFWYSDDIAYTNGLMVSPEFLRQHFFPLLGRIGAIARQKGVPFLYHSDGYLWDVMDDIIGAGVTSLHPIEPKAMDIRDMKRRLGATLALCGGVEVDLLARGSKDEICGLVRGLIKDVGSQGGWCAGSSNSIPEYVPVENYTAMVRTVLEEGSL